MPNCRWLLVAAVLCLGGVVAQLSAAAATPSPPGADYTINVWESGDAGLPQNSVIALAQTRDGYLWLGTLNGLARFDGMRFTVFDESNTPELKSSRIVLLFEDRRGGLWIGTENGGLALLKDGQLSSVPLGQGGAERRLVSACEDASGGVWFYCANGELWRYEEGRKTSFLVDRGQPSACRALIAETNGTVWVGTDWRQFATSARAGAAELPMERSLPARKLDFLLASQRGGFWRLADGRVQKWGTNRMASPAPVGADVRRLGNEAEPSLLTSAPTGAQEPKPSLLPSAPTAEVELDLGAYPWGDFRVAAALEDHEGNLLVGTLGAGVFWFDAQGQATGLSTSNGLSGNYILSLAEDREGSLWIGTDGGGLNRVKRRVFGVLPATRGRVVQSVCPDAYGGLWFGCAVIGGDAERAGFWRDGAVQWFGPQQGLLSASVRSVLVDRNQRVWAGTLGGLARLQAGRFLAAPGAVVNPEVRALFQDRAGRIWVGTEGGLACWDERRWRVITTRDGLSSDVVQAIAEDAAGDLWIGTRGGGLNRLHDGKFTAFRQSADGLPSDDISSLLTDRDGGLWIGTAGHGLARWKGDRWTRFTKEEGLASNSIGYLVEDELGFLWIGSNAGLMRVPKAALDDFALGHTSLIPCRTYGKADGLPTSECTSGSQPGACRAPDGTLWFPSIKGLLSVNPARLSRNTNPPPVIIESVRIEGREQNPQRLGAGWPAGVVVPARREQLEINYTSLNLAAPDRARFKYRLEGHEEKWTEAGNVRTAQYPKLPPGGYRFQVTACNEDGVWNDTGASLAITVEPPFWRTWWFLTAVAAGVLAAIVGGVYYASTQRLHRQLQVLKAKEALEKERARIARDIHDQLGANLTQVSLLSELVEADRHLPAEVEGHARQIAQTARDTARALDEIVWAANPSNDTLEGLINYVCKYTQDYLAVAGLSYRLDAPAQLPAVAIPPEVRHNVFLAAKESVNNVVKHAQAGGVRVRLRLAAAAFTLEIEDDGRGPAGIDAPAARSRNGLRNLRKRMEDVGGSFTIGPAPERGTLVCLTVPLGAFG